MLREFREFITRGNFVELAVAFIMGVAFARVVSSFTDVVLGSVSYVVGSDATRCPNCTSELGSRAA